MANENEAIHPIPPEVEAFIEHQDAELKDRPDKFIGRVDELRSLQEMVERNTERRYNPDGTEIEGGSRPPGRMYIAAPGAGKTSLMEELEERLRKQGFSVIQTKPEDISTPEKFAAIIGEQPPWSSRDGRRRVYQAIGAGLARMTDRLGGATLTGAALSSGVPLVIADLQMAQATMEKWQQGKALTTRETLQLLQHGSEKGCVLIVDEAQDIALYLDDKDKKEHINSVIRNLGIPADRKALKIQRATIILAGLSNTPTIVDNVGSQGIEPKVVAPLDESAIREVMRYAIWTGAGRNTELARIAEARWLEPLLAEYGDWTRQAQAGAQAAKLLLQEHGERLIKEDWGWTAVRKLADRFRDGVYGGILSRAQGSQKDKGAPEQVIEATTRGLIRNGNRIEQDKMTKLVDRTLETIPEPERTTTDAERMADAQRYIARMVRTGVLDQTRYLPNTMERTPQAYFCPIPSLLRYAEARPTMWLEPIQRALEHVELAAGDPTPIDKRFRPTWPLSTPVPERSALESQSLNLIQRVLLYLRRQFRG